MKIDEMNLDELMLYKAAVEVYGTAAELIDVNKLIIRKKQEKST